MVLILFEKKMQFETILIQLTRNSIISWLSVSQNSRENYIKLVGGLIT